MMETFSHWYDARHEYAKRWKEKTGGKVLEAAAAADRELIMKANYGYTDGSGDWYITIDTDRRDGCAKCVEACPEDVFVIEMDDYDDMVAVVTEAHRKKVKYTCGPCKSAGGDSVEPCHAACPTDAIGHSW
jgi:NAD-dependent dihydropyrimidine dehydrogenase PreA subunit